MSYAHKDVEAALDYGGTKKPTDYDTKKHDNNGGWIPKKDQGLAITIIVGFAVTFLADFCAKLAYAAYLKRETPPAGPPTKSDYELLFYLNMVYAVMFIIPCLCLIAPRACGGIDKMFLRLFWDSETDPNSAARLMEKQMGFIFLSLVISQLLQPSNPGVGLACLILASLTLLNFVAAVVFDRYAKLVNRYLMWTGFVIAPVVFIGAFTVALDRVQFFNSAARPWKDDSADEDQSLLFYLNNIHGLMYLPIALLNLTERGERFFMSFFLTEHPTNERGPTAWVMKNCALSWTAMAITNITAPSDTGVGVVMFFLNLTGSLVFMQALFGGVKTIKNKVLWGGFLFSSITFTVLFAVALNELDFGYDTSPWNMSN